MRLVVQSRVGADPHARLLVVTQHVLQRRGEIERAFLRFLRADGSAAGGATLFEFSLGVPLGQIALARSARLLLRWLDGPIDEHELDWLFSTGQTAAAPEESRALTAFMRALRRRGLQRTRWTLDDFIRQTPGEVLPAAWIAAHEASPASSASILRSARNLRWRGPSWRRSCLSLPDGPASVRSQAMSFRRFAVGSKRWTIALRWGSTAGA